MFFKESDDDSLMKKIANGEARAFRILFDRHAGKVLGYAKRLVGGDLMAAEDISQIVWMKVVQSAPHYRGEGHFVAWIYTMIRNASLSEMRKQAHEAVEKEISMDEEKVSDMDIITSREMIDQDLIRQAELQKLKDAIDKLPDNQRQALVIWMTEEVSYEELAHLMKTSVSAVKSLLFRARERIELDLRRRP